MYKRAGNSLKPHFRRLHSQASGGRGLGQTARSSPGLVVSSASLLTAAIFWYAHSRTIHNDVSTSVATFGEERELQSGSGAGLTDPDTLYSVVWGSNRSKTIAPDDPLTESIRIPATAKWLENVALRDLSLHREHAACVDAKGDVYQWGDGYFGSSSQSQKPKITLRGKNIAQIQLTESRLYALSASGKVYALSTNVTKQELRAGAPTPASTPWWGTGWLWGEEETVDFVEVIPREQLKRGEGFVSIAAGNDHLLALTSSGRTFAHPITKRANTHGQLGFRHFDIPDPSAAVTKHKPHLAVELVPKSIADPFANTKPISRIPTASDNLLNIDDSSIRFCPTLFEIPALKGVSIAQIAAGGRSSFACNIDGRVLGWGANEYGQIGLGSNVALDTITVPTEVVLWRSVSPRTRTKCINISAGGDLTAFTVERVDESSRTTVDVLMCGNGQWGGLGNNAFTNAQGTPVKAKSVSGLLEYNDTTQSLQPITPVSIAVSPTGHVLLTLNTSGGGVGGRDLVAWGKNYESELGNGKKSSVPIPTSVSTPESERFMLRTRKAKEVRDLHGKVWKRHVKVEQRAIVGFETSAVYWRIC